LFLVSHLARFIDKSTDAKGEEPMQIMYHRCCGIDVHKKMIVACLLIITDQGVHKESQTFTTMVPDLLRLRDWLNAQRCEAVAMESTGVYWKCIWNVLEGELELLLCNAQHIKAVPGRKTDIKDAEWIADLLQHGRLASQLCACPSPTGTAGFDALPQQFGRRPSPAGE